MNTQVKHTTPNPVAHNLWETGETIRVPLKSLHSHPELQPRDRRLIVNRHQRADQDQALEGMVKDLTTLLTECPDKDTHDPIRVAVIDGKQFIVDGHHRVRAYKDSKRHIVPAIIHDSDLATAKWASRWANTQGAKVALHHDELLEAAWKTMSEVSGYGRLSKEDVNRLGHSYGTIRKMYGGRPPKSTLTQMRKALTRLHEGGYSEVDWPPWKEARKEPKEAPEIDPEKEEGAIVALVHRILKTLDKQPPRRAEEATRRLYHELCPDEVVDKWDDDDLY